ncbi:MFS family permease [Azospirillum agricola]|uniref:MFS transporter n=1 Tax=Azospirillum agricola TaxID=1720247 RepID=UPI001AE3089F|nr:MFS transporter [Azospirillum agricola]MBP2231897.1 MFS family permease [Azospirillum agricola]
MTDTTLNGWRDTNRFLLVFGLLTSLMGTSVGVAKLTTALYAITLGADPEQLGRLAAGQAVGTLVMSVPIGFLVDHYGPRRLFVLGSALAGLTYALVPAVASPSFLLGCTTAVSFFMPLRFVSLNTVFFEQLRRIGAGKSGWYRATHLTGQFLIGPGLAVALIAHLGYAGTWWTLAASFVLTIAFSSLVFGRLPPRPLADAPGRLAPRRIAGELAALLRDRELRTVCLIGLVIEAILTYQTSFIVAIALTVFGLGESGASAFVTGTGLSFIATLFLAGSVVERLGGNASCRIGFTAAAIGLLGLGLAETPAALWPGVLLLGAGLGLLQTVTLARTARIGGRLGQGKVSGLTLLTFPVGSILGGLVGGWAGQRLGLQTVYLLFIPALLALLAWQWRSRPL